MPRLIAAMSGNDPDWFAKATETLSTGATYDARVIEAIYGLALAPTPRQRESLRVLADRKSNDSEFGPRERAFWILVRYVGWAEALRLARQADPDGQRAFAITAAIHGPSGRMRIPWESPDELWPQRSELVSFFLDQLDADPQIVRRSQSAQRYLVWIISSDSLPLDLRCRAAETLDGLIYGPSPLDRRVSDRLIEDASKQWERMWLLLGTRETGHTIDVDSVRHAVLGPYGGPGDPQPTLGEIMRAKGPAWTIRALASIQPPDGSDDARTRVHDTLDSMLSYRSLPFPPPIESGEVAQALFEYAGKAPPGHAGRVLSRLSWVYAPRVESILEQWITDERRCSAFIDISSSAISGGGRPPMACDP